MKRKLIYFVLSVAGFSTWFLVTSALRDADAQPLKLSLTQAIAAALENNANILLAFERSRQAQIKANELRSDLLPTVNAVTGYSRQTVDLAANGFQFSGLPPIAGPFNRGEARLEYSNKLLDLSTRRRYQSANSIAKSTQLDSEALKNEVAAEVARFYSTVLRSIATISATEAQIELDENLLELSRQRKEAGVGTTLDITRAESRLPSNHHQHLPHSASF